MHRLRIVEDHVHETPAGRYLVVHGDVFDAVTSQHRLLAVLGHVGYQTLIRLNRVYNRYRASRFLAYPPLFFVALVVLYGGLLSLFVFPG